MRLTRKFWGGLLIGAGVGLFVGGMIAEDEEPLRRAAVCVVVKHPSTIAAPGLALGITGMILTAWPARGPRS
jgi:hypothetical protein